MRNDFSIKFKERDSLQSSEFASLPNLEDAVALALALHRSSNVPHTIVVWNSVHDVVELTLKVTEDAK